MYLASEPVHFTIKMYGICIAQKCIKLHSNEMHCEKECDTMENVLVFVYGEISCVYTDNYGDLI